MGSFLIITNAYMIHLNWVILMLFFEPNTRSDLSLIIILNLKAEIWIENFIISKYCRTYWNEWTTQKRERFITMPHLTSPWTTFYPQTTVHCTSQPTHWLVVVVVCAFFYIINFLCMYVCISFPCSCSGKLWFWMLCINPEPIDNLRPMSISNFSDFSCVWSFYHILQPHANLHIHLYASCSDTQKP